MDFLSGMFIGGLIGVVFSQLFLKLFGIDKKEDLKQNNNY